MDPLQASRNVIRLVSLPLLMIQMLSYCSSIRVSESVEFGNISCNDSGITVDVSLKNDFQGVIFSYGNAFNSVCRYSTDLASVKHSSLFLPLTDCGTVVRNFEGTLYISNLVVIQNHPFVETASDMVYNVSCKLLCAQSEETKDLWTRGNHSSHFENNLLESWMDFKSGFNVLGKEILNNIRVGDEFSMVIHFKDGGIYKDLKVESCWAHEGETTTESRYNLPIFDRYTCESSDWVSDFTLAKEERKGDSNSMTYATIKAFKFPTTNDLHITCSIKVCKYSCQDNCKERESQSFNKNSRISKRSTSGFNDKSLRERYKLMKATIKVLGAKLIETNRADRLDGTSTFRRRISNSENITTTDYVATSPGEYDYSKENDLVSPNSESKDSYRIYANGSLLYSSNSYIFNLTNKVVVFKSYYYDFGHDYHFRHNYMAPIDVSVNCISKFKFFMSMAVLCIITILLLAACIGLSLYLHKEKKRNKINNYLLYNY